MEAPSSGGGAPRRRVLRATGIVVASMALVWAVTALGLVFLGRVARPPQEVELRIPPGAAREIAAGRNPLATGPTLSLVSGDVLVIVNDDAVTHRVGPYVVPPGGSMRVLARPSAVGTFLCTVHPSGRLVLDVAPRGLDLRLTVLPTLVLGAPLGAVVLAVRRILRALETPETA